MALSWLMNGSFLINWDDPPSRDLHIHLWISFFCFPLNLERNWNDPSWGQFFLHMGWLVHSTTQKSETKKSLKSRRSPWFYDGIPATPTKIGANVSCTTSKDPSIQPIFSLRPFPRKASHQRFGKGRKNGGTLWKFWGPCFFLTFGMGARHESLGVFFCQTILYFHLDVWGIHDPNLTSIFFRWVGSTTK